MTAPSELVKVPVLDVVAFEGRGKSRVECVQFKKNHFGLRLTNVDGEIRQFGLSRWAVEKIIAGYSEMLAANRSPKLREQKFIMEPKEELFWQQAN